MSHRPHFVPGVAVLALVLAPTTAASDLDWIVGGGGTWSNGLNWNPLGPPNDDDRARFLLNMGYTVLFSQNESCGDLDAALSSVTFAPTGNPRDLEVTDLLTVRSNARIILDGMDLISSNEAYIEDGGDIFVLDGRLTTRSIEVGGAPQACIDMIGPTASMQTAGTGPIVVSIGNSGSGFMRVTDGAVADIDGALHVANSESTDANGEINITAGGMMSARYAYLNTFQNSTTHADVSVSGEASSLTIDESLFVGSANAGTAILSVDGGTLDLGAHVNFVRETGTLDLTNGTLIADQDLTITTGTFTADATSTIAVTGGKRILVEEGGVMDWDRSVDASGPGALQPITYEVWSGGLFEVAYSCTLGNGANTRGVIVVDGGQTTGAAPGTFQPSTLRGAGGGAGGDLRVGVHGMGSLEVRDGGFVQFRDDGVFGAGSGSTASVIVDGDDATSGTRSKLDLTIGGANTQLFVGQAGQATLTIRHGGWVDLAGDMLIASSSGGSGFVSVFGSGTTASSWLTVGDDLAVGGTMSSPGGTARIFLNNSGFIGVGGDMVVHAGSIVAMDSNGHLSGPGTLTNYGLIYGGDDIEFESGVTNHGTLDPGQPGPSGEAGEFDISSDLVQTSAGTLRFDLFGAGQGEQDHLNIGGDLDFDGTLVIATPNGATIPSGTTFELIWFGGNALVDFDQIVPPPGMAVALAVIDEYVHATLTTTCTGDLDGSNGVDFSDLIAVLGAWGSPDADVDGDGTTGFSDLVAVLGNWGDC